MSLINDALKRAKESQPKNPPAGAPPLPPIQPPSRGGAHWILIVAAVLFLAAIYLCIGAFAEFKATPAPIAVAPAIVETQKITAVSPPVATPEISSEKLPRLQGILFEAVRPVAIVDRQTVRVGDRVGDYVVKAISENSVTFQAADGSLKEVKINE
jgi:hypothetical protein